jgi:murein DD-endopeptidase MepM/ murein hydrolase activator NlpD
LPDPKRRLRRLSESRPVRRALTHLVVIVLVVTSSALGIAAMQGETPAPGSFTSFELVGRARGAAPVDLIPPEVTYQLTPDPLLPDPMLQRRVVRFEADPTPLPTPVAPPPPTPPPTPRPVAKPQIVQGNGQLAWPVPGGVITQYYSASHLALDIAAPAGHPVVASDDGVVTWAGWRNNGGGLVVVIDHGDGIQTAYNHLGVIDVAVGQTVARGEKIASVGCTGNCTGPHVHFEVIVGGVIVNPLRYL